MSEFDPNMWDVSSVLEDTDTYDVVQGIGYATEQTLIQNSESIPVIGDGVANGVENLIETTHAVAYSAAEAVSGSDWVDQALWKIGLL